MINSIVDKVNQQDERNPPDLSNDEANNEEGSKNTSEEHTGDTNDSIDEMYSSGDDVRSDFDDYDEEEEEEEDDDDDDDEDEAIGPPEKEVEEKEIDVGDAKVTFKIFLQEDDEEFERWMKTIHVHCILDGKVIGRGLGRYVERDWIRSSFWRDMEEPCQELSAIAFEIFDRYGRLVPQLKNHLIRKGSGAFGSELDLGSFLVIEYMRMEIEWRRKGLGTKINTFLIEKAQSKRRTVKFSLVMPGWLTSDIDSETRGKTKLEQRIVRIRVHDAAVSFYHSLGFRRIGASNCFALPVDINHPAHSIKSADDFDPANEEPDIDEVPEQESVADWYVAPDRKSWRLRLLQERLPLHHAVITLPDVECVKMFASLVNSTVHEWAKIDRYSRNILHIAACEEKAKSVRWILEHSNNDHKLSLVRDVQGYTPLEYLESRLEEKRTKRSHGMMKIDVSDEFTGFETEAVECLAALHAFTRPSQIQLALLKYGCTCGACINGFLSPRMKFALLYQAEISHDMLHDNVDDASSSWLILHDMMIVHVASDIQQNMRTNKSYRQGFSNIFDHIATTLRAGHAPTVPRIKQTCEDSNEWPPVTKSFFRRGGNVESALRIIFERARDQDKWAGDGDPFEIFLVITPKICPSVEMITNLGL